MGKWSVVNNSLKILTGFAKSFNHLLIYVYITHIEKKSGFTQCEQRVIIGSLGLDGRGNEILQIKFPLHGTKATWYSITFLK